MELEAPGNLVIVEGDKEAKHWLRTADDRVDDWLYEIVDEIVFFAAARMRQHAPGGISELVDVDLADRQIAAGDVFEGTAGVMPDITETGRPHHHQIGSNPEDYPVFVEVGTGIFGPVGEPITSFPGTVMAFLWGNRQIFTNVVQGQRPQHYAEHSFEETVVQTEVVIRGALPELGRRE